jgi:membrane protein involved in colicin uptake
MPEESQEVEPVEEPKEPVAAQEAEGAEEELFDRARAEAKIKKANSEAKSLRERLKEIEPLAKKAKELEDAQKSEQERLTEQLTAAEQRAAKAVRTAVSSKVEALASADFADPEDAAGALDLATYADGDGVIDSDAIKRDLAELLKRKPHWAKPSDTGPRRPAPDRTQGSSGNGNRSSSDPGEIFAGLMDQALKGR